MKLNNKLIFFAVSLLPAIAFAQSSFKPGFFITATGENKGDSIKFTKGQLFIRGSEKTPKTCKPDEIKRFVIDTVNYISYLNDFYREIVAEGKVKLYQKQSDNSNEKIYNGIELVGFLKTTEGRIGDHYIVLPGDTTLQLMTKKNFRKFFLHLAAGNDDFIYKVSNGNFTYNKIKEMITLYNSY